MIHSPLCCVCVLNTILFLVSNHTIIINMGAEGEDVEMNVKK